MRYRFRPNFRRVVRRIGIDQHPIDLSHPDEARWLMACVWPDQADRFERIRAAIVLAQHSQTELRQADAVTGLRRAVADAAIDGHPVVINSWVLNYLTDDQRAAYLAELESIGSERDLSWVYAESPALCPGIPFPFELDHQHLTALMLIRVEGRHQNGRTSRRCAPARILVALDSLTGRARYLRW